MRKMHTGIKSYLNISQANNATSDEVVIDLIGVVGDWWTGENTKEQFLDKLRKTNASHIVLNISSPGGAVYDALAIYDAFKGHNARVTARLSGLVASAASFIALAADEIVASPTTLFMIHNVWGVSIGNKEELAKEVEVMGKHDEVIAQIYKKKTGNSISKIRKWMKEETWFSADEAKQNGFVDRIEEGLAFSNEVTVSDQQTRDFLTTHMNCAHIPGAKKSDNKTEMEFTNEEKGLLRKLANFFGKSEKEAQPEAPAQEETNDADALKNEVEALRSKLEEKESESYENLVNSIANALEGKIGEAVQNATEYIANTANDLKEKVEGLSNDVSESKENAQETAQQINARVDDLAKAVNKVKAIDALPENPENNGEGLEKKVAPENSFLSLVRARNN
jgi:ATP-dependent Clp protease protease subunit